ncbi:hypothetical protein [Alteribacter populi]|uniref:hypothetical protein n=1 Tax=Alteribacter populi TaxID=2011011 RepID=UPI000BBB4A6B|nr:hypothetical protein [Alteribacter populi]
MRKSIKETDQKIKPDDPVYDLKDVTPKEMAVLDLALKDRADILREMAEVNKQEEDLYLEMAEEAENVRNILKD